MLDFETRGYITEEALEDYIKNRPLFEDEEVEGTVEEQVDVDDFVERPGICTVPGSYIDDEYGDTFYQAFQDWLKKENAIGIDDFANITDQSSESAYYDFCMRVFDVVDKYWVEEFLPEILEEYFNNHAEFADYD